MLCQQESVFYNELHEHGIAFACLFVFFFPFLVDGYSKNNVPINVKPGGGGEPGQMWGIKDSLEEFLIKTPQISVPWRQIVSNIRISGRVFVNFTTL